jgi:hypothetical protein
MNLKPNQMGVCLIRKCNHEVGAFAELDKLESFNPALVAVMLVKAAMEQISSDCEMCGKKPKKQNKAKLASKRK